MAANKSSKRKRRSTTKPALYHDQPVTDAVESPESPHSSNVGPVAEKEKEGAEQAEVEVAQDEEEQGPTEEEIEDWEAFREEFYEVVEQLPLSLHRSYTLMRELDEQVEARNAVLLPEIKQYIEFRKRLVSIPSAHPTEPVQEVVVVEESVPAPNLVDDHHAVKEGQAGASAGPCNGSVLIDDAAEQSVGKGSVTQDSKSKKRKRALNEDSSEPNPKRRSLRQVDPPGRDDAPPSLPALSSSASAPSSPIANPTTPQAPAEGAVGASEPKTLHPPASLLPNPSTTLGTKAPPSEKPEPARVTTRRMLGRIAKFTETAVSAAEEKVGIARATYDLVDRHVRALDAKMKEYEASVAIGLRPGTHPLGGALSFDRVSDAGSVEPEEPVPQNHRSRRRDRRHRRKAMTIQGDGENEDVVIADESMPGPSDIVLGGLDMAIADSEPKYCYCHRVSFGEMVACDGPDCPNEWFHLECVGMSVPPKGRWFCDDCAGEHGRPSRKKRRH